MNKLRFFRTLDLLPNIRIKQNFVDVWILQKNILYSQYKYVYSQINPFYNTSISYYFLKQIVSKYTNINRDDLKISRSSTGKPFFNQKSINKLFFNISHSSDLLVYAISLDKQIGVDIESTEHDFSVDNLISRFFSMEERNFLLSLASIKRKREFLRYWVTKEAYLKATGDGISAIEQIKILKRNDQLIIKGCESNKQLDYAQINSFVPYKNHFGCIVLLNH